MLKAIRHSVEQLADLRTLLKVNCKNMIWTILMVLAGIIFYVHGGIKKDDEMWWIVGGIFLLIWLLASILPVYLLGFHFNTGQGEHNGYITAVQKQGIFFKTGRTYVKTDNQSSQEDAYCVINENVYKKLQDFSDKKLRVKVKYFSWFSAGIKNCEDEGDIIYEVEEIL